MRRPLARNEVDYICKRSVIVGGSAASYRILKGSNGWRGGAKNGKRWRQKPPVRCLRPTNLNTVKFSSYFKAVGIRNFPPLPSDAFVHKLHLTLNSVCGAGKKGHIIFMQKGIGICKPSPFCNNWTLILDFQKEKKCCWELLKKCRNWHWRRNRWALLPTLQRVMWMSLKRVV